MNKEKKITIIVLLSCLLFFFIYSFTTLSVFMPQYLSSGHVIFNWPDSNANYFFASLYSNNFQFYSFEPLNLLTDNLIHSRSINVINGNLVPMTWLPAVLVYGIFFKLLGGLGVLFLTPILASISGYLVYRLSFYIFKSLDLSLIITLLFLSLAPWVFFANEVMLPNIMFIFLVLLGWYFIARSWQKDSYNFYFISGSLFLSLAVFVRPTEFIWLAFISLFVLYINRQKINLNKIILGGFSFLLMLFLFLFLNKLTYGNFFSVGYLQFASGSLSSEISAGKSNSFLGGILLLLFPFGFDIKLIAVNFYKYFVSISWPHFIFAVAGLLLLLKNKIGYVWKKYLLITPFVFILILLYYASWDLADPLVKELNTISISYVRYFLPLYILVLPLIAYSLLKLFYAKSKLNQLALYLVVFALMLSSLKLAFLTSPDGLIDNKNTLENYAWQFKTISELIPESSIIITDRADKIFFPVYKAIVPQGDLPLWPRVEKIINTAPIYYYTDKTDEQLQFDRNEADKLNLDLSLRAQIWDNFRLYEIKYK